MATKAVRIGRVVPHALLHIGALAFIYLVPTLSHMLNLPIYYIEPMRLFIVLAVIHSHRLNAYILALTLPAFSFLISGHPVAIKMAIISAELLLNVWLFYLLFARFKKASYALLSSIVISKAAYYGVKISLIYFGLFKTSSLVGIPLWIQAITTVIFTLYIAAVFSRDK